MRLPFFFFFFIFVSFTVQGQQSMLIDWGEDHDFSKNNEYNEVLGVQDNKLYLLSTSGVKARNSINVDLEIYTTDNFSMIKSINLVENKSDVNFEDVVVIENKILVFTSFYDRNLGLKILISQEYNEEKNELEDYRRVDEVEMTAKDDFRAFRITTSPNKNYVLIYHDNPSDGGYKIFNLKVMNADYNTIWEKELTLNYKEKMVNFSDLLIDDASHVYLLSAINPFGLKKTSGLSSLVNVKSTLFVYRPFEDKLKEFEFALSRNWIDQVNIAFDDNQNLIATAYFTYPNDYKIRGFVLFEMNSENGEVTSKKMVNLDKGEFGKVETSIGRLKTFSRQLVGSPGIYPGSSSHMNSTSTEFITKGVLIQRDKIVIAIEAFRRDERCTESFNDQQMIVDCQKNFLYGDVILFYLNRDCQVQKISQVSKMQHAVNNVNPYYSASLVGNSEGIYVFYNDDYRNLNGQNSGEKIPLTNMNKASINIQAFDNQGDKMDLSFQVNDDGRFPFFPQGNLTITDRQFLLYSQREKNYKFGKLSIQ